MDEVVPRSWHRQPNQRETSGGVVRWYCKGKNQGPRCGGRAPIEAMVVSMQSFLLWALLPIAHSSKREAQLTMNDAVLTTRCKADYPSTDDPPSVTYLFSNTSGFSAGKFGRLTANGYHPRAVVKAYLHSVRPDCVGAKVQTPCAAMPSTPSWPRLFSCVCKVDGSTISTHSNVAAESSRVLDQNGDEIGQVTFVSCELPDLDTFVAATAFDESSIGQEHSLTLEVSHLDTPLPFSGATLANVITFTYTAPPPPARPPPPPPGLDGKTAAGAAASCKDIITLYPESASGVASP